MLHMALVFLVIGLIAAVLGFHHDCRRVVRDREIPGGTVPADVRRVPRHRADGRDEDRRLTSQSRLPATMEVSEPEILH